MEGVIGLSVFALFQWIAAEDSRAGVRQLTMLLRSPVTPPSVVAELRLSSEALHVPPLQDQPETPLDPLKCCMGVLCASAEPVRLRLMLAATISTTGSLFILARLEAAARVNSLASVVWLLFAASLAVEIILIARIGRADVQARRAGLQSFRVSGIPRLADW